MINVVTCLCCCSDVKRKWFKVTTSTGETPDRFAQRAGHVGLNGFAAAHRLVGCAASSPDAPDILLGRTSSVQQTEKEKCISLDTGPGSEDCRGAGKDAIYLNRTSVEDPSSRKLPESCCHLFTCRFKDVGTQSAGCAMSTALSLHEAEAVKPCSKPKASGLTNYCSGLWYIDESKQVSNPASADDFFVCLCCSFSLLGLP